MSRQIVFYVQDNLDQQTDYDTPPSFFRQDSRHLDSSPGIRRDDLRSPRMISSRTISAKDLLRCNNESYREINHGGSLFLARQGSSNNLTADKIGFRNLRSNTGATENAMTGDESRITSKSPNLTDRSMPEFEKKQFSSGNNRDPIFKQKFTHLELPSCHPISRDVINSHSNNKNPFSEDKIQSLNSMFFTTIRSALKPQEARELDAFLQKTASNISMLADKNTALKSQLEQVLSYNYQYQQNLSNLCEKKSKLEAVVKSIREENRVLRTQVNDLSVFSQSNKITEELFSKLEEEKWHCQALRMELDSLKSQLLFSQQAYLDLANEFNKTKLMILRQKPDRDTSPRKAYTSRAFDTPQSELIPLKSNVKHYEDNSESQIINENIKNMLGSLNNVTLDSRFVGSSNILTKKLDSTFNYGTTDTKRTKTDKISGHFASSNNQQTLSILHDHKLSNDSNQLLLNRQVGYQGHELLSGQYECYN